MKERNPEREPNLKEKTDILWQSLEEVEDLYLKDYPKHNPLIYSFGKTKVSINFACYEDCRDYGIGAISIATQEDEYNEFRTDIVIKKTSDGKTQSIVREYDLDHSSNVIEGRHRAPMIMPDLNQSIAYYEELLEDSKHPNITYRKIEHEDIDKASVYLDQVSALLTKIEDLGPHYKLI